jgi:hypothetical protein
MEEALCIVAEETQAEWFDMSMVTFQAMLSTTTRRECTL